MDEGMLNDLLECSVCLERLDSTSKVLPCQHTFCKRCLEEIVSSRKELRCPECRILVETKVEDLPCNILLIRILEGMKNAPRFKSQLTVSSTDISGQKTYACISQITTGSPSQSIVKTNLADNRTHTQSKQNFQAQQPSAKALYSYEAKEPGDLSFKKGDIILLRKKIDNNWYHGELDGKHGFFPASYVQVITPLPAHIPQCKALYDFKMNENEEKDCLTFSKGEVITVIRRVDENWAEGKLSDRIGIFPISFVEMNSAARALMKLSMNSQPGPSRIAPPTPSSDSETTPLITNNAGSNFSQQTSSSSTTQSSTSSGSSSSTTPSPSSPPPSSIPVPIPYPRIQSQRQQREKRHSFTVIPQTKHSPPQLAAHRHSVEIVSPSSPGVAEENTISSIVTSTNSVTTANTCIVQTRSGTNSPANSGSQVPDNSGNLIRRHSNNRKEQRDASAIVAQNETSTCAANSGSSIPNTHVAVPTFYVAMYQYKPQKEDELELKKGELYTVSEKCQDGWFKGTSLRNGQSGVFPGNYVQIAKSSVLQAHFRQTTSVASVRRSGSLPSSPSQAQGQRPKSSTQQSIRTVAGISSPHSNTNLLVSSSKTQSHNTVISYSRPKSSSPSEKSPSFLDWARSVTSLNPPPKPPRPQSPRSQQQVSPRQGGHRNHNAPELPPRSLSPMTASASGSLGQSSQPLLSPQPPISQSWHGSPSSNNNSNSNNSSSSSTTTSSQSRQILQPHSVLSTASAITPPNVSVACSVISQHRNDRTMEKKDKKEKDKVSFVKLLKSKKKSKSPPPSVYSMDNPVFVDCVANTNSPQTVHVRSGSCPGDVVLNVPSSSTISHKKSNSLDGSSDNSKPPQTRPKQPAPLVRERFRCIVPYPPNSEYEIELKVDDIIYVHKKRDDGWYKGTLQRTGKTGLFPASFVESF